MKVEELMIGDLVCYSKANNYYTQIKEIKCTHDIPDDVVYYIKGMRDRRDRLWIEFEETFVIDILSPIPLTVEILEKNGLCEDNHGRLNGEYFDEDENRDLEITVDDKTGEIWWSYNWDEYRIIRLRYVHELQHALRLCGITREIIL